MDFRWVQIGAALVSFTILCPLSASGSSATIAIASNFSNVAKELKSRFEAQTQQKLILAFGSTGKLTTQIQNGSPVDALLAADKKRPELLESVGLIQKGSRFTYAKGRLALWSENPSRWKPSEKTLSKLNFRYLAIANPKLAPYGSAAKETLGHLKLWKKLSSKMVRGENIAQTYQFVHSGNAQMGFVAYSQVHSQDPNTFWLVPSDFHQPIEQQAVLITSNKTAKRFFDFLKQDDTQKFIQTYGYAK